MTAHDWVIGAGGAHSTVPGAAAIQFEGFATGQTFYLADVKLESPLSTDMAALDASPSAPSPCRSVVKGTDSWNGGSRKFGTHVTSTVSRSS